MQQLKFIVDKRERNIDLIDALYSAGASLSFAQLPVGDYIISDRMCVERKTAPDFENSIIDGRLFEQTSRLDASFIKPLLILEGGDAAFRLSKNIILGAMLKLYSEYNIQLIQSSDPIETSAILLKLAEREQVADGRMPRIAGVKKAYTTFQWQTMMLGSLPGIGPNLALRLLSNFKTLKNIANADINSLMKVDKIGKKKASRIYGILNAEFEMS